MNLNHAVDIGFTSSHNFNIPVALLSLFTKAGLGVWGKGVILHCTIGHIYVNFTH